MQQVQVKSVQHNQQGLTDVVLECDGVAIAVTDIAWWDEESAADCLMAVFEEWLMLAQQGIDGYTVLDAETPAVAHEKTD